MNVIKCGLYARVSTVDQSTDMQLSALRDYCTKRGWENTIEFCEQASGADIRRPMRAEIIKLAKQRKIDAILVWKLDRWGRSTIDVMNTIQEIRECGVTFVSLTEAIDLSTPLGQMFLTLCAAFAQMERDLIRERVQSGVDRYREIHGEWGRPAKAKAKADKVLELHSIGWGRTKIARTLEISVSSVRRILNSLQSG